MGFTIDPSEQASGDNQVCTRKNREVNSIKNTISKNTFNPTGST